MTFFQGFKRISTIALPSIAIFAHQPLVSAALEADHNALHEKAWAQLHLSSRQAVMPAALIKLIESTGFTLHYQSGQSPAKSVVDALYPYADRGSKELFEMDAQSWLKQVSDDDAKVFLETAFAPVVYTPTKGESLTIVVFGAYASRRPVRQALAQSLSHYPVKQVITVTGDRAMRPEEMVYLHPKTSLLSHQKNEAYIFQENKAAFADAMQLPLDRFHFINSPIHPEIYSQPQQRATTFDNAIDLGRFLKQQQQLGVLSPKDPIVLCIERPFAVRMHMIVQDVLSHFIDNPVHLHTSTAYPDVPLKVGVNQAYMVPKAALDYQANVLPLITSYAQTLQCPSSSR